MVVDSSNFYQPTNQVLRSVMFLHLSFSHSDFNRGSTWAGTPPLVRYPQQVHPLGRYTPPACIPQQVHPLARYTPHLVSPPWAGISPTGTPPAGTPPGQLPPLDLVHAGRYRQHCRQYASYWNAFLFQFNFKYCHQMA